MIAHPYARLMEDGGAAVVVTLDLRQPVELNDFMAVFAGLGGQFERFIRRERPDLEGEVKVYVKEVRKGSIEALMILASAYPVIVTAMDHVQITASFVRTVAGNINAFRHNGGRLPQASRSELKDVMDTVLATANDPDGRAIIKSVEYDRTGENVHFAMEFNTTDARQVMQGVQAQFREIEAVTTFDHENMLLTFYQSNKRDTEKTGEKGIIEDISAKPLAVVYASDLARERIKSEMLSGDRNIYKLGFFVDVNVQHQNGRPVAYRIKAVREVIELPDDD